MVFDKTGQEITPIWYDRGSDTVTVRYLNGENATLPVSELTSPKGEAYIARLIRAVRVP